MTAKKIIENEFLMAETYPAMLRTFDGVNLLCDLGKTSLRKRLY